MAFIWIPRSVVKTLETTEKNPSFPVIGKTVYGKSTELAQILHRRANTRFNVIAITQPRIVVAVSVSRVQVRISQVFLACRAKTNESGTDVQSFSAVPFSLLAAEREETKAVPIAITSSSTIRKKERAVARVCEENSDGLLPATVLYLMDLGMELEQIKRIANRFPAFAYYTLNRKIKPLVEFLLELGINKSDIPTILHKRPQLCGFSLSDNLKPMMTYLESYGVDKSRWARVIYRFPALLTYSRKKVKASVDFLCELGVSEKNIGKILTRCPHIASYSVDEKLRPTAEYFTSLGIDAASLIHRCPQTFGLSIDQNLRPVSEFFLERGYSVQEIATMVSRYGALYAFSLSGNLMPKWSYFVTMDYPHSELVKFPQYFGYSLDERIKPRYSRMRECNVRLILNRMLSTSNSKFEKIMEKKMSKLSASLASKE